MPKVNEPEIGMVLLRACRCRCGHEWLPRERDEKPRVCPKCKSPNWDRPKKTISKPREMFVKC
jgi:predicted Zn-ribbon and HTH transcriptional regulator